MGNRQEGQIVRASVTLVRLVDGELKSVPALLTNQHSASSYDFHALVLKPYTESAPALGPGDVDGVVMTGDPIAQGAAEADGWRVARTYTEARQILKGATA